MVTKGGSGFVLKNAFTLVEVLVVVAILAILVTLGLPMAKSMTESGNAAQCLGNMRNIGIAALAFVFVQCGSEEKTKTAEKPTQDELKEQITSMDDSLKLMYQQVMDNKLEKVPSVFIYEAVDRHL